MTDENGPTQPRDARIPRAASSSHNEPDPHRKTRQPHPPNPETRTRIFPTSLEEWTGSVRPLDGQGEQRQLFQAVWKRPGPHAGHQVVVKVVPYARSQSDMIWRLWSDADSQHVVPLIDYGRFHVLGEIGEREFEVTPFCDHGSLADFASRRPGRRLTLEQAERVLLQIVETLRHIHVELPKRHDMAPTWHWVHRDIKPANILVRSEEPLELWLTDFGIARLQEEDPDSLPSGMTVAYAAPEAKHELSYQADYWSLGITLLELLRGANPFYRNGQWLKEPRILAEVHAGQVPIELPAGVPANWETLLGGLLSWRESRRWKYEEVVAWREGKPPPVNREAPIAGAVRSFVFHGSEFRELRALAEEMGRSWTAAAAMAIGSDWQRLMEWCGKVDGQRRQALHDVWVNFINTRQPADRIVAEVIVELDRQAAPRFRGVLVDQSGLQRLADRAVNGDEDHLAVVQALLDSGSLRAFSRLDRQQPLEHVERRWRELSSMARSVAAAQLGDLARLTGYTRIPALLLLAVVDPTAPDRLKKQAEATVSRQTRYVSWFAQITQQAAAAGDHAAAFHVLMILGERLAIEHSSGSATDTPPPLSDVVQPPPALRPAPSSPRWHGKVTGTTWRWRPVAVTRTLSRSVRVQGRLSVGLLDGRGSGAQWSSSRMVSASLVVFGYVLLVCVAGVAVAQVVSPAQGLLCAAVLAVPSAALVLWAAGPSSPVARILLGVWQGTGLGVVLAATVGIVLGVCLGSTPGWSAFWIVWPLVIIRQAVRGAVR